MRTYTDPILAQVRDACARTLFLCAWADAVEGGECPACGAVDSEADSESAKVVGLSDSIRAGEGCPECGRDIPNAGPGDAWEVACSDLETPAEAFEVADRILAGLGDVRQALDAWACAVVSTRDVLEVEVDLGALDFDAAERFGHCAALQALGHGVGLGDDVPHSVEYARPDVPSVDFHAWDFDGGDLLEGCDGGSC